MYLNSLAIDNFRNLASLEIPLDSGVNILYGDNASGKTNLVEAVFVLCLGRSHRGAPEVVLVRDDADYYRLEGQIYRGDQNSAVAVAYQRGGRKKVTVDRVTVRLSELYNTFAAVVIGPEDSRVLSGSPARRRNFIDVYLSQYSSRYLSALGSYQRALSQKNAALKKQMDPSPFDHVLVEAGSAIMNDRLSYLAELGDSAVTYYRAISGGGDLDLRYQPSVKLPEGVRGLAEITVCFQKALGQCSAREKTLEMSLVGTHRDDIYFAINGLPARTHGSQGEWRTAAIALKLAVYNLIREKRNLCPVLLLDEIFAELDNKRSQALMTAIEGYKQLFLTTAVEPPDFLRENSRAYRITAGRLAKVD
jgi:DNA replication and repair protein RecF